MNSRPSPRPQGRPAQRPAGGRPPRPVVDPDAPLWISGRNPVIEALRAGLPARSLWLKRGGRGPAFDRIRDLARQRGLRWEERDNAEIDRRVKHTEHRGVALEIRAPVLQPLQDWLQERKDPENLFLLLLDGLQDPQNLGAVARSALAAGVDAIVLPQSGRAPLSDAAFRSSAGALAWQPLLGCPTLEHALDQLGRLGLTRAGLTERGAENALELKPLRPLALVLGAEGRGLSPAVLGRLDRTLRIPMRGQVESLNASVAAGVMLFRLALPEAAAPAPVAAPAAGPIGEEADDA